MACAILLQLSACLSPANRVNHIAISLELQRQVVLGSPFEHVLFWRNGGANQTLHIYLEGDGSPVRLDQPAKDPTPRDPLMLYLMSLETGPAVYLGRPCYHGLAESTGCISDLWTHGRYSERVVASMATAIRKITALQGDMRIALFGHSGGGTLAMLLAERLPETQAVVTIAANLNIHAWADYHGYPRLTASLNPAARPLLPDRVLQRHYVGNRDRIVPVALAAQSFQGSNATLTVIDGYNHVCCWAELWPGILADVGAATKPTSLFPSHLQP